MRPETLRILVVDDHALMREAVCAIIADADGLELVGEAETAAQALRLAAELRPDLVLLDLGLPDVAGLACLESLRRQHPDALVVVFSGFDDPQLIDASLARGAAGYVLKRINPLDLPAALRQAVEQTVFHRAHVKLPDGERPTLSGKELEVMKRLALGHSNREIAKELWISDQTVKFHLRNVYRKLGASTRTEALRIAHERALVATPL